MLPGQLTAAASPNGCMAKVSATSGDSTLVFFFPQSSCKPSGNLWEFCYQRSYN